MHIVNLKKGLTMEQAMADPQGIAVLGFFINVCVHKHLIMYLLAYWKQVALKK